MNPFTYNTLLQKETADYWKHPTKKRAPKSQRKKKRKVQKIARRASRK
ncbi:hypothetical protein [Endozoicomonas atrinae]|nr:hypothetical protein [Endozoicomonas atrinae]